jgi:hypothetical protein
MQKRLPLWKGCAFPTNLNYSFLFLNNKMMVSAFTADGNMSAAGQPNDIVAGSMVDEGQNPFGGD